MLFSSVEVNLPLLKDCKAFYGVACEQALLFGQAILARLVSLAQIGELARRLFMVVMDTINSVDKAKSLCGFTPNRRITTVPFETKSFFLLNTSTLIYNVSTLATKSFPVHRTVS